MKEKELDEKEYRFLFFSMAVACLLLVVLLTPQLYTSLISVSTNNWTFILITAVTLWALGLLCLVFLIVGFLKKSIIHKIFFNSWRFSVVAFVGLGTIALIWQLINFYINR